MDHHEAVRREAVEKYLLSELPGPERDEFEEHFFDCQECAADLRTTAAFLDAAKRELKRAPVASPVPKAVKTSRFAFLWSPAFASPAFALLLLVIVYQNVAVYPRLTAEVAQTRNPEILPSLSLIGGNSRGGAVPSATVGRSQPILLSVDIPAADQYVRYSCVLVAPSGAIVWRAPVSASQAKDTISIRLPANQWGPGAYKLLVQGYTDPSHGEPVDLASYRFTLNGFN
jgi:anti-sigma factor RsiW